jgi:hypothetical protein
MNRGLLFDEAPGSDLLRTGAHENPENPQKFG